MMAIEAVGSSQNYFSPENVPKRISESPPQPQPKSETVTMSTDRVDREIESLKSKGLALAKSINRYDDEETRLNLEEQLKQIQSELSRKDNDIYRRQKADISLGVDVMA